MRSAILRALIAGVLLLAATLAPGAVAPLTRQSADALLALPETNPRNSQVAEWARHAPLDDLLWVLRRPSAELGKSERVLVQAALDRAPSARSELRRRLEWRRALADPGASRKVKRENAELEMLHPRASVYRVGTVLPDKGDYAGYGESVRIALGTGLAWERASAPSIDVEPHGSGDNEPALALAALDTASRTCGIIVGELLSTPTFALAGGTRFLGLPLVSPTATDESIGRTGPMTFAIGPSSEARAAALAQAMFDGKPRKLAILTSNAAASDVFVKSFAAAAESLGARIVRRETYSAGSGDFKLWSRAMRTFGAEVLFWDGESREADALVRQLAADGIALKLCGGSALAPDRMHTSVRALLDGVRWVSDDWKLPAMQQAMLDSLARSRSEKAGAIWVRGFLAGRRIAAAVDAGARTPAELGARLRHRNGARRAAGFLECTLDGAMLPVFVVARGKSLDPAPSQPRENP